jgi:hypothetical protein
MGTDAPHQQYRTEDIARIAAEAYEQVEEEERR